MAWFLPHAACIPLVYPPPDALPCCQPHSLQHSAALPCFMLSLLRPCMARPRFLPSRHLESTGRARASSAPGPTPAPTHNIPRTPRNTPPRNTRRSATSMRAAAAGPAARGLPASGRSGAARPGRATRRGKVAGSWRARRRLRITSSASSPALPRQGRSPRSSTGPSKKSEYCSPWAMMLLYTCL